MGIKVKVLGGLLGLGLFIGILGWLVCGHNVDILQPAGIIADKQKRLIIVATLLAIIVVIPVYALTIGIAWKYRANNKRARYTPDWDHDRLIEGVWWGIPIILIGILSVITWQSSHDLDPFRPISGKAETLKIQVVAMQWKWMFIYPDQNIATVNYARIPVDKTVDFEITADAPMNSFWIPKLGGQIYAMSGMSTHLHLQANKVGAYQGSSANISGEGFARMRFVTYADTAADFSEWVEESQANPNMLDKNSYTDLARPSVNNAPATYALADKNLYNTIIMKYMGPSEPAQRDFQSHLHRGVPN